MTFTLNATAQQLEAQIRANRLLSLPVPWEEELIYPHYGGLSIYNLTHSILQNFGAAHQTALDENVWGGESPIGDVDRVILFLSDGLGYKRLNALMDVDAEIRDLVHEITDGRGALPLTSITPSTTAVALPTLWTGSSPAEHGMVGTIMFLREFATLGDMLSYRPFIGDHKGGIFEDWNAPAAEFVNVPSLAERLHEVDTPTYLALHYALMDSGLSKILHRGIKQEHKRIHAAHLDTWLRLQEVFEETAGKRCFINAYWGVVDNLSHVYGADTPYIHQEVKYQLKALRDILNSETVQDGRTLFLFLADHGHHDVPENITMHEGPDAQLLGNMLRFPFGGDRRFSQLYLRSSNRTQVINTLSRDYIDRLAWIEPETAIHNELFGPGELHPELMQRLGDVIVTPRLGIKLSDGKRRTDRPISMHGGLTDWEMLVPLIWKRI